MATAIKMPQLSDTMSSGKILAWSRNVGDKISRGDVLAEVETDKANLEIESFHEGVLLQIVTLPGAVAQVGEIIAYIGAAGETVENGTPPERTSEAAPPPVEREVTPPASFNTEQPDIGGVHDRVRASPLARKIAAEKQIGLSAVRGSGPLRRIVRRDLEIAATPHERGARSENSLSTSTSKPHGTVGGSFAELSKMRETIARRMQESVRDAPHFYTTVSINMGEAMKLREILKKRPEFKGISVNHLVIKAAAYALSLEGRVNCALRDGNLYTPDQINIGIITAVDDGLLIPVLKSVDSLPLRDVVFEARAAIDRVRAGRPTGSDLSGGTFTISNLGMFSVENFTAIINPGQGAILAVGAIQERPVVLGGIVVAGHVMQATLSVDHRIIDGVMSATFCNHFKEALENPALLLL